MMPNLPDGSLRVSCWIKRLLLYLHEVFTVVDFVWPWEYSRSLV